jgi:hypothetical protein
MLTPMFPTIEDRADIAAMVDAKTDEEIEEIWAHYGEEASKRCPECGRPYDDD